MDAKEYNSLCKAIETEYLQSLHAIKSAYEERRHALNLVWQLAKDQNGTTHETAKHGEVIKCVRAVIRSLSDGFSLRDVESALEEKHPQTLSVTNRKSISSALRRLQKEGFIALLQKGKGKAPSMYMRDGASELR